MDNGLYEVDILLPKSWSDFSSEHLYWMLAHRRETFDEDTVNECFDILSKRYYPLYIAMSRRNWKTLYWNRDDAYLDALEHLWGLIYRKTIKFHPTDIESPGLFYQYIKKSFRGRAVSMIRNYSLRNPLMKCNYTIGYSNDEPIYVTLVGFDDDYIEKYNAMMRNSSKKYREKKKGNRINGGNEE